MKCTIQINIEVPDKYYLIDEYNETVSEKEQKEYADEYYNAIKDLVLDFPRRIKEAYYDTELDEYYNEDGELPDFIIEANEIKLSQKENKVK